MSVNQKSVPSSSIISREPYPGSRKIYISGQTPGLKVGMREVLVEGSPDKARSIPIYDTSGPYTDPQADINIKRGLPRLREGWIKERGDVEELSTSSSSYASLVNSDESLRNISFPQLRAQFL